MMNEKDGGYAPDDPAYFWWVVSFLMRLTAATTPSIMSRAPEPNNVNEKGIPKVTIYLYQECFDFLKTLACRQVFP